MNYDSFYKFIYIILSYSSVIIPTFFFVKYYKKNYFEYNPFYKGKNFLFHFFQSFAIGHPEYVLSNNIKNINNYDCESKLEENINLINDEIKESEKLNIKKKLTLCSCLEVCAYFSGIQITLVSMGFFQERIMTQKYQLRNNLEVVEKFSDAQFLVFLNRFLNLIIASIFLTCTWKNQPVHVPPLYEHSFASVSNILASYCQYEALKYVSFPIQTVCKASKIIPTMIFGRLWRKKHYRLSQYGFALIIVTGAIIFFFSIDNNNVKSKNYVESSTSIGLILMASYLFFDAYTPNQQKKLMEQNVSCVQMMFWVNFFSAILSLISLLQQFTFFSSLSFLFNHESFFQDCCLLSISSSFGQIFIYQTIKEFGPLVFAIIMTVRQIVSIILSAVYFSHSIHLYGAIGLVLVFGAILFNAFFKFIH